MAYFIAALGTGIVVLLIGGVVLVAIDCLRRD